MATIAKIDALPERPNAEIFGKIYLFKSREDLSIADIYALDEIQERYNAQVTNIQDNKLDAESSDVLSMLIDKALRALLDAPKEVHDGLNDQMRLTLIIAYRDFYAPILQNTPAMQNRQTRRNGKK